MVVGALSGLYAIALLACPIGMGLMMWFMAKGMGSKKSSPPAEPKGAGRPLADLKAEQARLAARIEALEGQAEDQAEQPEETPVT